MNAVLIHNALSRAKVSHCFGCEYLALSAGLTLTVDCQHYVAQQIDVDPTRFCPLGRIAPEALEQAR